VTVILLIVGHRPVYQSCRDRDLFGIGKLRGRLCELIATLGRLAGNTSEGEPVRKQLGDDRQGRSAAFPDSPQYDDGIYFRGALRRAEARSRRNCVPEFRPGGPGRARRRERTARPEEAGQETSRELA
jgi:hypothetical protein